MNLLCFPFAGGNSYCYSNWNAYLDSGINMTTIELAGRGTKHGEPLAYSIGKMIEGNLHTIQTMINSGRYILFGHSMGSAIAFEFLQQALQNDWTLPQHVIFSGRLSPYVELNTPKASEMSDEAFIHKILSLNNTSSAIFSNDEMREIFLPILRADYYALEEYLPPKVPQQIPCAVSVFHGRTDTATNANLNRWGDCAGQSINYIGFEGGHFFIKESVRKVVDQINEICSRIQA